MTSYRQKVLLVDDDAALLRLLRKWLEMAGYETQCASDGQQAQNAVLASCPNFVITDWDMPNVDGVELCRWLREQDLPNYVYTLFLTNRSNPEDMVLALESGADDFVKKPVVKDELLARVRSGARVLELESKLSILAKTDPLTGLMTRRTFLEQAEKEWRRATRHFRPMSCVMVDLDYFKRINDTYGHRAGDQALRAASAILKEHCRGSDLIARYGGEEFCILLPETTEENAANWADRVRHSIASRKDLIDGLELGITASFGAAQRMADTETPEAMIDLADQALLVAKRAGRDRVISYQNMNSTGKMEVGGDNRPEGLFSGLVASDVMATIVAGLSQDESVGHAAQYFLKFRFSSAPVVDESGKLVGVLSERDVMSIMLTPEWWTKNVKDVMKRNVVCYEEETPVLMIYEFLCRVSLRGVVIVRHGQPTGMISRTSLLRWFSNRLSLHRVVSSEDTFVSPATQSEDPRSRVTQIAEALSREAVEIESQLRKESNDLLPVLVGGVSRLEELINDMLSYSRYACVDHAPANADPDVVQGLAAILGTEGPPKDGDATSWLNNDSSGESFSSAIDAN